MRIGLRAPRRMANFGGVATYEHEMFDGLLATADQFPHVLVIFGWQPRPDYLADKPAVEWVQLRFVPFRHLCGSLRRVVNLFLNRVLHLPSVFRSEHWIDSYLRRHKVDFYINVIPEVVPTVVPFMSFVFDVLHRLHPYFPEASQAGVWVRREDRTRQLAGRAAILGVGTEVGRQEVMRFYPVSDSCVHVLPFPTPNFALAPVGAVHAGECPYGEYLFFPASFFAHKNHATLLHALAILRDKHGVQLNLVLSGKDWGNREHVEELIRHLNLESQVRIVGFVSRDELIALYRGAVALVFPSLLGPDNIPPLEAFGLGCPALVAEIPGAAEQTAGAALLFPATDEHRLAEAILRIRNSPEFRAELIARGRVRAEKYTNVIIARRLWELVTDFGAKRRCWGVGHDYSNRFNWKRLIGG